MIGYETQEQAEFEAQQLAEEEGKRLELEGCATEHEATVRDSEYEELKGEDKINEGTLIDYLRYLNGEGIIDGGRWRAQFYDNPYKLGKELYQWLQKAGWRPVKEIKKEAKD